MWCVPPPRLEPIAFWRRSCNRSWPRHRALCGQISQERLSAALALLERAGGKAPDATALARQAASGLYYATAAAVFLREAQLLQDAVREDLARLVLSQKLMPRDPLAAAAEDETRADRVIAALVAARRP